MQGLALTETDTYVFILLLLLFVASCNRVALGILPMKNVVCVFAYSQKQ
jgi:hypothetical protein